MRRLMTLCWAVLCVFLCTTIASAAQAEDISGKALIADHSGFSSANRLFDGRTMESLGIRDGGHITLTHEVGIGSVYLVFGTEYGSFTVRDEDTGREVTVGEAGFLHEFVNLEEEFGYAPEAVTIFFGNGEAKLSELSAFAPGDVPDWVQQWLPPAEENADLVLFSTHGDDEQLFFAGMLPYYAAERNYRVQVVYMTGHRNMTMRRCHEMLDGLWAVGVRHYPVFGPFGDYNAHSLAEAYQKYHYKGIEKEDIFSFVVENIRRFRPKVAVGHDLKGEYGHGMHMIYGSLLCEAVEVSHDPEQFPDSAETYGIWEVPKTYLHLYPEREVWMNWDVPLESFGGMTAFEVTRELGFPCHVSQQSYYSWYFKGMETASEIPEYSPCEFGLYRSTVGDDVEKNDLFEHMTSHSEDAALEEQWRAEEEARRRTEEAASRTEPAESVPAQTMPQRQPEPEAKVVNRLPFAAIASGILGLLILLKVLKKENKKFEKK